jgi:eukaryotic-like serine/threonine-protein kinase
MECAACGATALEGSRLCPRCSTNHPSEARERASSPRAEPAATPSGGAIADGPAPEPSVLSPLEKALSGLAGVSGVAQVAGGLGALRPGDLLGPRYEIVRLLGKGGMGAVYLARDRELGRDVALKLIAPHLATEAGTLERFKREIQLSSIVTHPNVLRVYDLGESDGVKFLTMQYIEGETLADAMRRERPLPIEKALSFFRQMCDALSAAHEKGVLHRDLKPQNVMLDAAGHAYLTDFGLARSSELSTMTQAGALMGTPQYMSPEQVKGTPVDARSDIFSVGVILYEMLAGALPYSGDTVFELMIKRTQAPPRPARELNPAIPAPLQALLERCLAIDPGQRYGSAREILTDLEAGTARPLPRRRRTLPRRAAALAAALVLVAIASAAAWKLWPRSRPGERPPQMVLVADFRNETGDPLFDGTLEPALGLALEGASFLNAYNRGSAQRIADGLKLAGSSLEPDRARLVAQREGVHVVASGGVSRARGGYRVTARVVDP